MTLLLFLFCMFALGANATTWYVYYQADGSIDNSLKCKDVSDAVAKASAGDTIKVHSGRHVDVTVNIDKPVTIEGDSTRETIIDHQQKCGAPSGSGPQPTWIIASPGVVLKQLTFTGNTAFWCRPPLISVQSGGFLSMDSVSFDDFSTGVFVAASAKGLSMTNCHFSDAYTANGNTPMSLSITLGDVTGVFPQFSATNATFQGETTIYFSSSKNTDEYAASSSAIQYTLTGLNFVGGGIFALSDLLHLTVDHCQFSNSAQISTSQSRSPVNTKLTLTDCQFSLNSWLSTSGPTSVEKCSFVHESSIFVYNSKTTVTNSVFSNSGSNIPLTVNEDATAIVVDCSFLNSQNGALHVSNNAVLEVYGSTFQNNSLYRPDYPLKYNSYDEMGAVFYCYEAGAVLLKNSVFINNQVVYQGPKSFLGRSIGACDPGSSASWCNFTDSGDNRFTGNSKPELSPWCTAPQPNPTAPPTDSPTPEPTPQHPPTPAPRIAPAPPPSTHRVFFSGQDTVAYNPRVVRVPGGHHGFVFSSTGNWYSGFAYFGTQRQGITNRWNQMQPNIRSGSPPRMFVDKDHAVHAFFSGEDTFADDYMFHMSSNDGGSTWTDPIYDHQNRASMGNRGIQVFPFHGQQAIGVLFESGSGCRNCDMAVYCADFDPVKKTFPVSSASPTFYDSDHIISGDSFLLGTDGRPMFFHYNSSSLLVKKTHAVPQSCSDLVFPEDWTGLNEQPLLLAPVGKPIAHHLDGGRVLLVYKAMTEDSQTGLVAAIPDSGLWPTDFLFSMGVNGAVDQFTVSSSGSPTSSGSQTIVVAIGSLNGDGKLYIAQCNKNNCVTSSSTSSWTTHMIDDSRYVTGVALVADPMTVVYSASGENGLFVDQQNMDGSWPTMFTHKRPEPEHVSSLDQYVSGANSMMAIAGPATGDLSVAMATTTNRINQLIWAVRRRPNATASWVHTVAAKNASYAFSLRAIGRLASGAPILLCFDEFFTLLVASTSSGLDGPWKELRPLFGQSQAVSMVVTTDSVPTFLMVSRGQDQGQALLTFARCSRPNCEGGGFVYAPMTDQLPLSSSSSSWALRIQDCQMVQLSSGRLGALVMFSSSFTGGDSDAFQLAWMVSADSTGAGRWTSRVIYEVFNTELIDNPTFSLVMQDSGEPSVVFDGAIPGPSTNRPYLRGALLVAGSQNGLEDWTLLNGGSTLYGDYETGFVERHSAFSLAGHLAYWTYFGQFFHLFQAETAGGGQAVHWDQFAVAATKSAYSNVLPLHAYTKCDEEKLALIYRDASDKLNVVERSAADYPGSVAPTPRPTPPTPRPTPFVFTDAPTPRPTPQPTALPTPQPTPYPTSMPSPAPTIDPRALCKNVDTKLCSECLAHKDPKGSAGCVWCEPPESDKTGPVTLGGGCLSITDVVGSKCPIPISTFKLITRASNCPKTASPTSSPTSSPTPSPTLAPTPSPTSSPTNEPSAGTTMAATAMTTNSVTLPPAPTPFHEPVHTLAPSPPVIATTKTNMDSTASASVGSLSSATHHQQTHPVIPPQPAPLGTLLGGILGGVAFAGVLCGVIFVLLRKRQKRRALLGLYTQLKDNSDD